jgi:midasin (ATPase involved in ribosome maturation)
METKNNLKKRTNLVKNGNSVLDSYMNKELGNLMKKFENDFKEKLKSDYFSINQELEALKAENKDLRKHLFQLKDKIQRIRNYKTISINIQNGEHIKDLGKQHFQFEKLSKYVQTKNNIFLVGSAGSGKTTAARNIAKALNIKFYFTGAINSEYKLTGFIDAQGRIVNTEFRKAYEHGGLFLFDEIDASFPQAILAFNAALANDFMDFPDKKVPKHKNFYCIAAANTFGTGADRQYVGRNQLDAATLDRFITLNWEIDETLEHELAKNYEWVNYVQKARKAASKIGERHIISPRASMQGADLLRIGIDRKEVEKDVVWKGLDASRIEMIKNNMG